MLQNNRTSLMWYVCFCHWILTLYQGLYYGLVDTKFILHFDFIISLNASNFGQFDNILLINWAVYNFKN